MKKCALLISLLILFAGWLSAQNVGVGTLTPIAKFHVQLGASGSDGVLFTGVQVKGNSFPSLGAGNRLMFYPGRGAFRAGVVTGTQWDNNFVGGYSAAFGYNTIARNAATFATGNETIAGGYLSSAFGSNTITKSVASMVIGMYNDSLVTGADEDDVVSTSPLFIIGNGDDNNTRNNAFVVYKNGNLLSERNAALITNPGIVPFPVSGSGTRMMWIPDKSAFRVGTTNNGGWEAVNTGTWSFACGFNNAAIGDYSTAVGSYNNASGVNSMVMGSVNNASGNNSIAAGSGSVASGSHSMAMGAGVIASGNNSFAIGANTIASANNTTAIGELTKASGVQSMSIGFGTLASGASAFALGGGSIASGAATIAAGNNSRALGSYSVALNQSSITKGYSSTVIGMYNDSILTANQTVVSTTTPLFIVGNGDGTAIGQRHNAMMVRKDGNVGIGTNAPSTTLHVATGTSLTNGFLVDGTFSTSSTYPTLGGGSRLMYYPAKAALRAGRVLTTRWDNINTGDYSVAFAYNTMAFGTASFAVGGGTIAMGDYASALGLGTIAKSYGEVTIGQYNDTLLVTGPNPLLWESADALFVAGNGTNSVARSNAFIIYKNGKTEINGNADVDGFTHLGNGSPNIKMKKLIGTSSNTQGTWVNIVHGLTKSKILGVDVILNVPGFVNLPPGYTFHSNYEYQFQVSDTNIVVLNINGNSANILSKDFTVLITYEE